MRNVARYMEAVCRYEPLAGSCLLTFGFAAGNPLRSYPVERLTLRLGPLRGPGSFPLPSDFLTDR
jgi:hypothetical protein